MQRLYIATSTVAARSAAYFYAVRFPFDQSISGRCLRRGAGGAVLPCSTEPAIARVMAPPVPRLDQRPEIPAGGWTRGEFIPTCWPRQPRQWDPRSRSRRRTPPARRKRGCSLEPGVPAPWPARSGARSIAGRMRACVRACVRACTIRSVPPTGGARARAQMRGQSVQAVAAAWPNPAIANVEMLPGITRGMCA